MAKRRRGNAALNRTAVQLGRVFGRVAARVESLSRQRAELRTELQRVIDGATSLMNDLGGSVATAARAGRRGTKRTAAAAGGGRPKRRFSSAARARMAEAARKRWARHRKEQAG